jgi:hypothetical protein
MLVTVVVAVVVNVEVVEDEEVFLEIGGFVSFLDSISKKHFSRVGPSGTRLKKLSSSELGM